MRSGETPIPVSCLYHLSERCNVLLEPHNRKFGNICGWYTLKLYFSRLHW